MSFILDRFIQPVKHDVPVQFPMFNVTILLTMGYNAQITHSEQIRACDEEQATGEVLWKLRRKFGEGHREEILEVIRVD